MSTLNTEGWIAAKFDEDVVQTLDGKTHTHLAGTIITIKEETNSITLDVVTTVAGMRTLAKGTIQGFCPDQFRDSVA